MARLVIFRHRSSGQSECMNKPWPQRFKELGQRSAWPKALALLGDAARSGRLDIFAYSTLLQVLRTRWPCALGLVEDLRPGKR